MSGSQLVRCVRTLGAAQLHRSLLLTGIPAPGARVDLCAFGGGLQRVEEAIYVPRGERVGFLDPGVTLILAAEPGDGLEAAQAAGWQPLTAAETRPAA